MGYNDEELNNEKEFNETLSMLEPMPSFPMSRNDKECIEASALISIAISLKRLADSLGPQNDE